MSRFDVSIDDLALQMKCKLEQTIYVFKLNSTCVIAAECSLKGVHEELAALTGK